MKVAFLEGKNSTQIVFNYNSIVKDSIKTVKGWHYDVVCKKWFIPNDQMDELIIKLEKLGFSTVFIEDNQENHNIKRKFEDEILQVNAKKPLSANNKHIVKASKFSSFMKLHLPMPFDAYNVIKNLQNIIMEKNSWIIKNDIKDDFLKICQDNNICVDFSNEY